MYSSITDFVETGLKNIEKMVELCLKGEEEFSDLSQTVHDQVNQMELRLIGEIYELIDSEIRESITRKFNWNIEHRNKEKTIEDIAGTISLRTALIIMHTLVI